MALLASLLCSIGAVPEGAAGVRGWGDGERLRFRLLAIVDAAVRKVSGRGWSVGSSPFVAVVNGKPRLMRTF